MKEEKGVEMEVTVDWEEDYRVEEDRGVERMEDSVEWEEVEKEGWTGGLGLGKVVAVMVWVGSVVAGSGVAWRRR